MPETELELARKTLAWEEREYSRLLLLKREADARSAYSVRRVAQQATAVANLREKIERLEGAE